MYLGRVYRNKLFLRLYFYGLILKLHAFKMMAKPPAMSKVFTFKDYRSVADQIYEITSECLHPCPVPIVIDNGSFQTRAGWACPGDSFSAPRLQFKSVAARSRGAARSETQIGNDISNLEPLRWLLKSQFDRNVVVNFEIQELMFDYVFMHLGIGTSVSSAPATVNQQYY